MLQYIVDIDISDQTAHTLLTASILIFIANRTCNTTVTKFATREYGMTQ